jgi:hypothetical protein
VEIEELRESEMNNFDKDYEGFIAPTPQETAEITAAFK